MHGRGGASTAPFVRRLGFGYDADVSVRTQELERPPAGGIGGRRDVAESALLGPTTEPEPRRSLPSWVPKLLLGTGVVGAILVGCRHWVRAYIVDAKTAEARFELARIAEAATRVWEREGKICPSASATVPKAEQPGLKYQSTREDWEVDRERDAGFACLGYSKGEPQYFQYTYTATPTSFRVTAKSTLGEPTTYVLEATGVVRDGELVIERPSAP